MSTLVNILYSQQDLSHPYLNFERYIKTYEITAKGTSTTVRDFNEQLNPDIRQQFGWITNPIRYTTSNGHQIKALQL